MPNAKPNLPPKHRPPLKTITQTKPQHSQKSAHSKAESKNSGKGWRKAGIKRMKNPRKRLRYIQAHDGEWLTPRRRGWRMKCCDCALIHRVTFRIVKIRGRQTIQLKSYRDNRATAAARRKKTTK